MRNLPSLKNIQFDLSQFEWFDNPENMSLNVLNLMCLKMKGTTTKTTSGRRRGSFAPARATIGRVVGGGGRGGAGP